MYYLAKCVQRWIIFSFACFVNNQIIVSSLLPSRSFLGTSSRYGSRSWSEWSQWSACSRTCSGGVRQRTRECITRILGHRAIGGDCNGNTIEYEICSSQACSDQSAFLDFQCSQKNGQTVMGKIVLDWIPYRYRSNPCELQCWPRDRSLVYSFGKVVDGTECSTPDQLDPQAVCINGRCTALDCTGRLGSRNRRDRCGVCQGDNSTCVRYHDTTFGRPRYKRRGTKDLHEYDYISMFSIPAGAMHIRVSEDSKTNFLVLVDHMGNYLVNGNRRVQPPGRFLVHGAEFTYNRTESGTDTLSSMGPTRFIVKVMVMGSGDLPTIQYEYWISTIKITDRPFLQTPSLPSNSIETSLAYSTASPIPKFHTYKSYYHRNEVLKSVPSWSIKRHKFLKQNFRKQFDIKPSVKWRNGTSDHLRHLGSYSRISYAVTVPTSLAVKLEQKNDWERPDGTSAFTGLARTVTRLEDGAVKTLTVETTTADTKKEKSRRRVLHKAKTKPDQEKTSESRMKKRRKADQGRCPPCMKNKQQTRSFCESDFVIRATVIGSDPQPTSIRHELEVIRSYKNKVPIVSREYVWTPSTSGCPCPKLKPGQEYIVMGRLGALQGRRESQLIVDDGCFVRKFTEKRARTLLRLVRDQRSVCARY